MTATNAEVLDGIETALSAGCPGVKVYRVPPMDVVAPAVLLTGFTFEPHLMMGPGARRFTVELTVAVSGRATNAFNDLLDLMDPSNSRSVQAALEDDPTLGGVVSDLRMQTTGDLRELNVGETGFWAMTAQFEVIG
jgi:hypothetical protein